MHLYRSLLAAVIVSSLIACGPQHAPDPSAVSDDTLADDGLTSGDADFTIHMEEVETPADVLAFLNDNYATGSNGRYLEDEDAAAKIVVIEEIVNMGKKAWKVVQKGKPVADVKNDFANALPQGADSGDLEKFSNIQQRSFRYWAENLYKQTVFDVTFTVVHQYGGSYKGNGRYIANAGILASSLEVLWGYQFNAETTKVSVTNVGSKAAPVASLALQLKIHAGSFLKKTDMTKVFQFRGDTANVRETN